MQFVIALCQVVDIERVYTLRQINPVLVDAFDAVGEADFVSVEDIEGGEIQAYRAGTCGNVDAVSTAVHDAQAIAIQESRHSRHLSGKRLTVKFG